MAYFFFKINQKAIRYLRYAYLLAFRACQPIFSTKKSHLNDFSEAKKATLLYQLLSKLAWLVVKSKRLQI